MALRPPKSVVAVGGGYIGLAFQRVKRFLKKVHAFTPIALRLWKTSLSPRGRRRVAAQLAPFFLASSTRGTVGLTARARRLISRRSAKPQRAAVGAVCQGELETSLAATIALAQRRAG